MITGGSGRLGIELKKLFPKALTPKYTDMDIIDGFEVGRYIFKNLNPGDIVIHCAAMVDVGECEKESFEAYWTNSIGTFNLAFICDVLNIKLVYISTDHVFDGEKNNKFSIMDIGYNENDIPNPQGVYAKSKLIGEWFTLANPNNLVIRTSFMKDFKLKGAFTDKYWSGLWVEEAAKQIAKAAKMDLIGLYHIAGERTNVYDFVKTRYKVKPIKLSDNPISRSGLPYLKDTSLDISKWRKVLESHNRSA